MKYTILTDELVIRYLEAFKKFYEETEGKPIPDTYLDNYIRFVFNTYKNPDYLYLLAVEGKKIRGFLTATPLFTLEGEKVGIVNHIYVVLQYRYNNIGKQLIEIALSWAKEKGFNNLLVYDKYDKKIWFRKQKSLKLKPQFIVLVRNLQEE
jgi:GNAT superfamily N-acetyltransferase